MNEAFARQMVGGGNPVGKVLHRDATSYEPGLDFQIVGLVKETKYYDLRDEYSPIIYLPMAQSPIQDTGMQLVIRSAAPFADLTSRIKSTVAAVSPRIDINFQNFHTMIGDSLLQERLMATLSGFFGFLAAVLATVGLYGVISYMVVRRTNEIGIRIALGADCGEILTMILREAGMLLAIGVAAGAVLSITGAKAANAMLYGLKSYDPVTSVAAIVLLVTVAVSASALPARRASRLDPMVTLRREE